MTTPILHIGDFGLSSWSMRPWLALKAAGLPFQTKVIPLGTDVSREAILSVSPSGKVPALHWEGRVITESLAICELAAELAPEATLWPTDQKLRALARSAASEMHAGFTSLRTQMSFGLESGDRVEVVTEQTQWDIERILAIWSELLAASQSGTFLCGSFGIVDAMYAPVVFRFRRYSVELPDDIAAYAQRVLAYPFVQKWMVLANKQNGASC
jgi:glutathione S-transferase